MPENPLSEIKRDERSMRWRISESVSSGEGCLCVIKVLCAAKLTKALNNPNTEDQNLFVPKGIHRVGPRCAQCLRRRLRDHDARRLSQHARSITLEKGKLKHG